MIKDHIIELADAYTSGACDGDEDSQRMAAAELRGIYFGLGDNLTPWHEALHEVESSSDEMLRIYGGEVLRRYQSKLSTV